MTVSFSGCTGARTCPLVVSQTDGIVIMRLEPSYDLIPVSDVVTLVGEFQNKGNAEAKNIKATLWSAPGFKIIDNDAIKDGVTPAGAEPDKTQTTMAPPRLDICSAGDSQVVQWQLQAGCDPRETTLAISVDYDYTSDGWASIFLVSADEALKTGGKFSEKGQNFPSAGPVQVLIEPVQTEPIILSPTAHTFDVRVKVKNLADGIVGTEGSGDIDKVTLTVDGPCTFSQTLNKKGLDPSDRTYKTMIFSGANGRSQLTLRSSEQEALQVVKLELPDSKFAGFVKDFCRVTANAEYHYRTVEDVKKRIGITGTPSQVAECRTQLPAG